MIWGLMVAPFVYGYAVGRFETFPFAAMNHAWEQFKAVKESLTGKLPDYYIPTSQRRTAVLHQPGRVAPGMTLLTGVGPKGVLFAKLVDADGRLEHYWDLDWFRMWPDARHVPADRLPKQRPGADIHGIVLSPNGDLTFNFGSLAMVQVDVCDRIKWRLPRLTHHAMDQDASGNFWTLDLVLHDKPAPGLPNYQPPFEDDGVLEVSPDGRVLRRFSVFDLLRENGLQGLLYMSSIDNASTTATGDTLHVNDVDVFPASMQPGLFKPGDVMVSLRNINVVFVFDPATRKIKQLVAGHFIRQHDTDFLDGSTISVFDNNNVGLPQAEASSRIVQYSFKTGQDAVLFQGSKAVPFYSYFMGKQQRLDNGDLLLTEATQGHALEVNAKGEPVWEYFNQLGGGNLGVIEEAMRIPPTTLSAQTLQRLAAKCPVTGPSAGGTPS